MTHWYGYTTHGIARFMDIRQITPDYAVSPQIEISDVAEIANTGFTTLICNRPDAEIPPTLHATKMRTAAKAAGLKFVELPVTHSTMTPDLIAAQAAAIEASEGPALAYCASGTRSTIVWALSKAGTQPVDEIIATAAEAGYQIEGVRPHLDAIAKD